MQRLESVKSFEDLYELARNLLALDACRCVKDTEGFSSAFTKVLHLNGTEYRFFFDRRDYTATLKMKVGRNGHSTTY